MHSRYAEERGRRWGDDNDSSILGAGPYYDKDEDEPKRSNSYDESYLTAARRGWKGSPPRILTSPSMDHAHGGSKAKKRASWTISPSRNATNNRNGDNLASKSNDEDGVKPLSQAGLVSQYHDRAIQKLRQREHDHTRAIQRMNTVVQPATHGSKRFPQGHGYGQQQHGAQPPKRSLLDNDTITEADASVPFDQRFDERPGMYSSSYPAAMPNDAGDGATAFSTPFDEKSREGASQMLGLFPPSPDRTPQQQLPNKPHGFSQMYSSPDRYSSDSTSSQFWRQAAPPPPPPHRVTATNNGSDSSHQPYHHVNRFKLPPPRVSDPTNTVSYYGGGGPSAERTLPEPYVNDQAPYGHSYHPEQDYQRRILHSQSLQQLRPETPTGSGYRTPSPGPPFVAGGPNSSYHHFGAGSSGEGTPSRPRPPSVLRNPTIYSSGGRHSSTSTTPSPAPLTDTTDTPSPRSPLGRDDLEDLADRRRALLASTPTSTTANLPYGESPYLEEKKVEETDDEDDSIFDFVDAHRRSHRHQPDRVTEGRNSGKLTPTPPYYSMHAAEAWNRRNDHRQRRITPNVSFGDYDTIHHYPNIEPDQETLEGTSSWNSEYTKSMESEVEDVIKDFLFIGSPNQSLPGRRRSKSKDRQLDIDITDSEGDSDVDTRQKTTKKGNSGTSGAASREDKGSDDPFTDVWNFVESGISALGATLGLGSNDDDETQSNDSRVRKKSPNNNSSGAMQPPRIIENVPTTGAFGGSSPSSSKTPKLRNIPPAPAPAKQLAPLTAAQNHMENAPLIDHDLRLEQLAIESARMFHKLQGYEFDESTEVDIVSEIKFIVADLSLPLGVIFQENPTGCWITKVMPDGTASRTSIRVGDQLAAIDGISAIHMKVDHVAEVIRQKDNQFELTLLRYVGPLRPAHTDVESSDGYIPAGNTTNSEPTPKRTGAKRSTNSADGALDPRQSPGLQRFIASPGNANTQRAMTSPRNRPASPTKVPVSPPAPVRNISPKKNRFPSPLKRQGLSPEGRRPSPPARRMGAQSASQRRDADQKISTNPVEPTEEKRRFRLFGRRKKS